jgi:hypothetical protein
MRPLLSPRQPLLIPRRRDLRRDHLTQPRPQHPKLPRPERPGLRQQTRLTLGPHLRRHLTHRPHNLPHLLHIHHTRRQRRTRTRQLPTHHTRQPHQLTRHPPRNPFPIPQPHRRTRSTLRPRHRPPINLPHQLQPNRVQPRTQHEILIQTPHQRLTRQPPHRNRPTLLQCPPHLTQRLPHKQTLRPTYDASRHPPKVDCPFSQVTKTRETATVSAHTAEGAIRKKV